VISCGPQGSVLGLMFSVCLLMTFLIKLTTLDNNSLLMVLQTAVILNCLKISIYYSLAPILYCADELVTMWNSKLVKLKLYPPQEI
jgi:hypothetical protein